MSHHYRLTLIDKTDGQNVTTKHAADVGAMRSVNNARLGKYSPK